MQKRVSPRFWSGNNKTYLQVKYGTKLLELYKDKNTMECASQDELIKTLLLVKSAVASGELDSVIEAASVKVRERFGR